MSFKSMEISQIDKKLGLFKNFEIPKEGWIKTIRKSLSMTYNILARKNSMSPQVIKIFEKNEIKGSITLNTLKKIAASLNCRLVYAIVPDESFEKMIDDRINKIADTLVGKVSDTMMLESQKPGDDVLKRQRNELVHSLKSDYKKIWKYEI